MFGRPIVAPDQLPEGVDTLYVGLNPVIAREALLQLTLPHHVTSVLLEEASA